MTTITKIPSVSMASGDDIERSALGARLPEFSSHCNSGRAISRAAASHRAVSVSLGEYPPTDGTWYDVDLSRWDHPYDDGWTCLPPGAERRNDR